MFSVETTDEIPGRGVQRQFHLQPGFGRPGASAADYSR
jgi:hypothetical protein